METEKGEARKVPGLVDLVFSWSLVDIMNKDVYNHNVQQIPDTFQSTSHYLSSFVGPLVAETHADLRSCMLELGSSPVREIDDIWESSGFNNPKNLKYMIKLDEVDGSSDEGGEQKKKKRHTYEPECWDLFAISGVLPKRVEDLIRAKRPYTVALLMKPNDMDDPECRVFKIRSSRPVDFGNEEKASKMYAVYLTNLLTHIRIWNALHPDKEKSTNFSVIRSVLRRDHDVEEGCMECIDGETATDVSTEAGALISSLELDDSQKSAVLNSVALTRCRHRSSVKLIWGPPGTGKTKTISTLAYTLLRMKFRTLVCTPTNVAVTGVANRLMSYMKGYGLGDVVLVGNGKRMKIEEYEVLYDVFLQFRVFVLYHCLLPATGWKATLNELINLLSDPFGQYSLYLEEEKRKQSNEMKNTKRSKDKRDNVRNAKSRQHSIKSRVLVSSSGSSKEMVEKNVWKKIIIHNLKFNNKKSKLKLKIPDWVNADDNDQEEGPWLFEKFFRNKLSSIRKRLILFMSGFYVHLPTEFLRMEVVTEALRALDLLQELETRVTNLDATVKGKLQRSLLEFEEAENMFTTSLCSIRQNCLHALNFVKDTFDLPDVHDEFNIRNFCLVNARLLFCTVSSSANLFDVGVLPLVIIDEAAQVKECESCIPLQLPGVQHAILVGDEKQLPAMVMNKTCEEAGFGRSLFQRVVELGHNKHLLNVQYRMHPSISLFPNDSFYDKQIRNGCNVMEKSYERRFVEGKLFGTYSFINVGNGKEEFDNRHSRRNMVEVSVVAEIVSKLYKESLKSKKRVSVGCISPYKGQVSAIQASLGRTYSSDAKEAFSVNVRSVDGFQGGEQDVIIISTVRCNGNGSIGFLSNNQRTNVALTRARFCLWIVGNEATLLNSNSIWQKLVSDAKDRGCFHNADEDESLSAAIRSAMVNLEQLDRLFSMDSILFKAAKWKVCFSARFHDSMIRYRQAGIRDEVVDLLVKLAQGWRPHDEAKAAWDDQIASFELLEWCKVANQLKLVWTVNILREGSTDTQVMNILDILSQTEISKQAKDFEVLFGNYTMKQMQRCVYKRAEGGLTLPMSWVVGSGERSAYSSSDALANQIGVMRLTEPGRPVSSSLKKVHGKKSKW